MGSGRRYDPRLPGSSRRGKTPASPPHLVPQLLLQLPVVVVPDQEVQGEVSASVVGRGHGEGGRSPALSAHLTRLSPRWGSPAPARRAAGERREPGERASERARYAAGRPSGRVEGTRGRSGGRAPGRGRGSAAPTLRPAALPPALTARKPTSAGRTAPNREVRRADHRAPRRGGRRG